MKMSVPHFGWQPLERATFGLIYGAIMVLSIVMALELQPSAPFRPAMILFGSVLAMTLARTLATLFSHGVETGERIMNLAALRAAWRSSHPILIAAYPPTALFMAAGLGWLITEAVLSLSKFYCVFILAILGARAGWVIRGGMWHSVLGAVSAGGLARFQTKPSRSTKNENAHKQYFRPLSDGKPDSTFPESGLGSLLAAMRYAMS